MLSAICKDASFGSGRYSALLFGQAADEQHEEITATFLKIKDNQLPICIPRKSHISPLFQAPIKSRPSSATYKQCNEAAMDHRQPTHHLSTIPFLNMSPLCQ